jgi:hypothetical protein
MALADVVPPGTFTTERSQHQRQNPYRLARSRSPTVDEDLAYPCDRSLVMGHPPDRTSGSASNWKLDDFIEQAIQI